jgi:hypothetical protein
MSAAGNPTSWMRRLFIRRGGRKKTLPDRRQLGAVTPFRQRAPSGAYRRTAMAVNSGLMQKLFRSSQSARPFAASVPLGSRSRHACRARWRSWPAARTRQPSAKTMPPATLTGYCIGTLCRLFSIEHVPLFFSGGSQAGRGTVENWKRRTWVACIWVSTFIQTLLGPRA